MPLRPRAPDPAARPVWSSTPWWTRAELVVANVTRGTVLAHSAWVARTALTRFVGLAGRRELSPGHGLLLPDTRAVHTFFLAFPIDVALFDREGILVAAVHDLRPWSLSPYRLRAAGAVELPAGTLRATQTAQGDRLILLKGGRRLAELRRQRGTVTNWERSNAHQ